MNSTALQTKARGWLRPAVVDRIEQVVIVVLWSIMAWRMSHTGNPYALLVLASETAIVLFVLIRRPAKSITMDPAEWALAFGASCAPLLVMPNAAPIAPLVPIAVALLIVGNFCNLAAKFVLRRSFGIAPANRGLKLTGPYRVVRHPMYGGYLMSHVGIFILMPSWQNALIYVVGWAAQIRRLGAEERILSQDPRYREYKAEVRYRLVPGVY